MTKPLLIILWSISIIALPAMAENIRVPIGQQSSMTEVAKPRTGATKATVEAAYGEPINRNAPTGEPPISSWEYAEFVVYFEYDHVIHTVTKHRRKDSQ